MHNPGKLSHGNKNLGSYKNPHMNIHSRSKMTKTWNQPRYPEADEWFNKLWDKQDHRLPLDNQKRQTTDICSNSISKELC